MTAYDTARDIRDAHRAAIMALPDVVGSGIDRDSYDDAVIRVYLARADHLSAYADLMQHIEGVPVEWEVIGLLTDLLDQGRLPALRDDRRSVDRDERGGAVTTEARAVGVRSGGRGFAGAAGTGRRIAVITSVHRLFKQLDDFRVHGAAIPFGESLDAVPDRFREADIDVHDSLPHAASVPKRHSPVAIIALTVL